MSAPESRLRVRTALLIVASWIAIAAGSGGAVYRIMRRVAADEPAGWEEGEGPALVADPSQASMLDDLALRRPRAGATNEPAEVEGSGAAPALHTPVTNSEAARNGNGTTASAARALTPQQQAAAAAARKQELAREARTAAHQQFQAILTGSAPWSSLTPTMAAALGQEDITAGLAKVEAMPWGPEANQALQTLLRRWAEMDPRAAADYALGLKSNRAGGAAIRGILGVWAEEDPGPALDWYLANLREHPAMLTPSLRSAFMRLAATDPARALATAWQLPDALGREALRAIVSQSAMDGNLEALRTVVGGMVPGAQRNLMMSAIIQEYAVYHPEEAVRWINLMDDVASRNAAVGQLVSVWGYDRPEEAARWVASLPDAALLGRSAATLIRSWSATEPEAAGDWLMQLPPSRSVDSALEIFVRNTMRDDPARAMQFVERMTDPRLRKNLVLAVGKVWQQEDPVGSRAYFQTSTWEAGVRNRFL